MIISVQNTARQWRVIHPQQPAADAFEQGADAFDSAAALALAHYLQTGHAAIVRVHALGSAVDVLRVG